MGYQLQRLPTTTTVVPDRYYTFCVLTLIAGLANGAKLRCVQIGANDGKINDPLFEISTRFADRTKLLLIEPQAQLVPVLTENFDFHPDVRIEQVAIGEPGTLLLYGVKEEEWPDLHVPYAQALGWPPYRAPTGIVSSNREHVAGWLRECIRDPLRVDDAIECFEVESVSLASVVDSWNESGSIDVLQIDTEGFDDHIIMSCDLDRLQPKLIFFEAVHLTKPRQDLFFEFLNKHGYTVVYQEEDGIALRLKASG